MASHNKAKLQQTGGDDYLRMLAGYICFDEIMSNQNLTLPGIDTGELDIMTITKTKFVDKIIDDYLTDRERLIFKLRFEMGKTVSDIMYILGYNNYQTTQKNIVRVIKLIRCYYIFETIPKKQLEASLKKNFTTTEIRVLELMQQRLTVFQIKDYFNLHYKKMYWITRDVMEKLQSFDVVCQRYHDFLFELRKFRNLPGLQEEE